MCEATCGQSLDGAVRYDFVRFTFADMHGVARSRVIPQRHVADVLKNGTGVGSRACCICCNMENNKVLNLESGS